MDKQTAIRDEPTNPHESHVVGDVFQINETHGHKGLIGAFLMATEIKTWGVQGFVSHVETLDRQTSIYLRLNWSELDFIGHAPLIPDEQAAA